MSKLSTAAIVCIDTETTGLVPPRHRVWELSAQALIVEDGELVIPEEDNLTCMIRLTSRQVLEADQEALKICGFMERYVPEQSMSARHVGDLLAGMFLRLKDKYGKLPWFMGNNPTFDHNMLSFSLYNGLPGFGEGFWNHQMINVVDQGAAKLGWLPAYRSWDVGKAFGLEPPSNAHQAWADVKWNIELFARIHGLRMRHLPVERRSRQRFPQVGEMWQVMFQGHWQRREILEVTPQRVKCRMFDYIHGPGYGKGNRDGTPWELWFPLVDILERWTPPSGELEIVTDDADLANVTEWRPEAWREL